MKVTAAMAMAMPVAMLAVRGSPNISEPTSIAVIGSNTPSTEAFVAPMLRVAMASEAVETIVDKMASPMRLSQADSSSIPAVTGMPEVMIF